MKLRNFLYINTSLIDNYIAAIDGYDYDEEVRTESNEKIKSGEAKGSVPIISANGSLQNKSGEEIKKSVKVTAAAKFERIVSYLGENLKYYEFLPEEEYNNLSRDDFVEVLVNVRFSKLRELTQAAQKISQLAEVMQALTDQQLIDKETSKAINGISQLNELKGTKEVSCVFNFEDKQFPMVAYLDEQFFKVPQENFIGQVYMLAKIQKKISKGQNLRLDEIFDNFKNLALNREQKRKMPKNMNNPKELSDIIHGPAFVVIPVAIYQ